MPNNKVMFEDVLSAVDELTLEQTGDPTCHRRHWQSGRVVGRLSEFLDAYDFSFA